MKEIVSKSSAVLDKLAQLRNSVQSSSLASISDLINALPDASQLPPLFSEDDHFAWGPPSVNRAQDLTGQLKSLKQDITKRRNDAAKEEIDALKGTTDNNDPSNPSKPKDPTALSTKECDDLLYFINQKVITVFQDLFSACASFSSEVNEKYSVLFLSNVNAASCLLNVQRLKKRVTDRVKDLSETEGTLLSAVGNYPASALQARLSALLQEALQDTKAQYGGIRWWEKVESDLNIVTNTLKAYGLKGNVPSALSFDDRWGRAAAAFEEQANSVLSV